VDRDIIWKLIHIVNFAILNHYGILSKFIRIIQQLFDESTCQVIQSGKLKSPFSVKTGLKQGFMLSPKIFLMLSDWIMQQTIIENNMDVQYTFTKQIEDLDFADDVDLQSSNSNKYQQTKVAFIRTKTISVGKKFTFVHKNHFCHHKTHISIPYIPFCTQK
jgi:hypothetical protein